MSSTRKATEMENCNNGKVSFDPGWNDPPKISYDATVAAKRPRNFLNKRVAFPLSGMNVSPVPIPPANLPPMPIPAAAVRATSPDINHEATTCEINSESAREQVKDILLQLLEKSSELRSKANDVKRRLAIMEQMWIDGKFNKDVQAQMKDLAYALRDDEPHKADAIHQVLMVNHVSAVGNWMPGVKQLIHLSIARAELLAIDQES